jgi:hypothetical protein
MGYLGQGLRRHRFSISFHRVPFRAMMGGGLDRFESLRHTKGCGAISKGKKSVNASNADMYL